MKYETASSFRAAIEARLQPTYAQDQTRSISRQSWGLPYRKLASEIGLDPIVAVGHKSSAAFLDPILSGNAPFGARWDPGEGVWKQPDDSTPSG